MQRETNNHQPKPAQVIALIKQSYLSTNLTASTSSMILYLMFPAYVSCSSDSANTILKRRFRIPCKIRNKKLFIQIVNNYEIFRIYSTPLSNEDCFISAQANILDELLTFRIQLTFSSDIMEDDNWINNMLDFFTLGYTSQHDTD